jgi:histidine triad (HIT) family protein
MIESGKQSGSINPLGQQKDCIFCQIIEGKKPADFVYHDESLVVFKDINPKAPVHLLVVPRKHIRSINDLTEDDGQIISEMLVKARDVAWKLSIADSGYKLIFNVELGGGQIIFHLHMHLLGGW